MERFAAGEMGLTCLISSKSPHTHFEKLSIRETINTYCVLFVGDLNSKQHMGGTYWHIMHVCCIASQCACMHQHSLPCIDCNVFCTCMYDIYMYVASRITLCVCTCIHTCVLLHHCMHMPLHLCIQFALSCQMGAGMTTSV